VINSKNKVATPIRIGKTLWGRSPQLYRFGGGREKSRRATLRIKKALVLSATGRSLGGVGKTTLQVVGRERPEDTAEDADHGYAEGKPEKKTWRAERVVRSMKTGKH